MKTKEIIGGEIRQGSVVYEVNMLNNSIEQFRVLYLPPTDWSIKVFDVALDDGYTRKNGRARSLCKTEELAIRYLELMKEGSSSKIQEFIEESRA